MSPYLIHPLSTHDAPMFRVLRVEGLKNHPEAFGADADEEARRPLVWFADRLSQNAVFGGFDGSGELCGVVAVARGQSAKTKHSASIWGMYVKATYRGTGLARDLLAAAVENAFADCRTIRLGVIERNTAARRFYANFGFRQWAIDVGAIKIDDVYHDEVMMRLDRP